MKWTDKLSPKQRYHLEHEALCTTLESFKRIRAQQNKDREKKLAAGMPPGIAEPCWTCREIAHVLEIEPEPKTLQARIDRIIRIEGWTATIESLFDTAARGGHVELARELENILVNYVPGTRKP